MFGKIKKRLKDIEEILRHNKINCYASQGQKIIALESRLVNMETNYFDLLKFLKVEKHNPECRPYLRKKNETI